MSDEPKKTASGYRAGEWTTKPDATAECLTCDWRCVAKNAHGAGARHARAHKHMVRVEVSMVSIYNHETS